MNLKFNRFGPSRGTSICIKFENPNSNLRFCRPLRSSASSSGRSGMRFHDTIFTYESFAAFAHNNAIESPIAENHSRSKANANATWWLVVKSTEAEKTSSLRLLLLLSFGDEDEAKWWWKQIQSDCITSRVASHFVHHILLLILSPRQIVICVHIFGWYFATFTPRYRSPCAVCAPPSVPTREMEEKNNKTTAASTIEQWQKQ